MTLNQFENTQIGQTVEFVGEYPYRHEERFYTLATITHYHYTDDDELLSCDIRFGDGFTLENVNHGEIDVTR